MNSEFLLPARCGLFFLAPEAKKMRKAVPLAALIWLVEFLVFSFVS